MAEEIRVHVVDRGRRYYYMRYRDPVTGEAQERSTGVSKRKDAERAAARWEKELQEGTYTPRLKVTWAEFRQRYEDEHLSGLADNTDRRVTTVFRSVEELLSPRRLRDVTADALSRNQQELRKRGLSETTIQGHLAYLGAALRWAHDVGMLAKVPKVPKTRRAKTGRRWKRMKGRPITLEEFERMLQAVPKVLIPESKKPPKHPPTAEQRRRKAERDAAIIASWRHYLRGLWLSGLRLDESLELYWDRDDRLRVDLEGRRPMLRIPAELEKGHRDRLLPITPDFAEFLLEIPESERTGRVFQPMRRRNGGKPLHKDTAGDIISDIGRAAGVKVYTHPKTGAVKYASAHDLRRSFGSRWSRRVMPTVLQALMRHETIDTTMRYYVEHDAESTADALWADHAKSAGSRPGDTSGDTRPVTPDPAAQKKTASRGE